MLLMKLLFMKESYCSYDRDYITALGSILGISVVSPFSVEESATSRYAGTLGHKKRNQKGY